jgi:bacteriorhodopsin
VRPDFGLFDYCEETDMADAEAPTVTFPDDYPNSVRHFLLIGFLGMFIGSIVFFYMGISRKVNTVSHVLTFFIAAVASCSYYAMWAGLGVEYKTTDTTPRVIFWARYLDWIVTLPVSLNTFLDQGMERNITILPFEYLMFSRIFNVFRVDITSSSI